KRKIHTPADTQPTRPFSRGDKNFKGNFPVDLLLINADFIFLMTIINPFVTMKKIILTLALLGGVLINASAQKTDPGKFSLGLEAGVPVGSARNTSTFTIGGSLKYGFAVASKTSLTVSGGYIYFPYRGDVTSAVLGYAKTNSGEGYIPLKAGVKYFLCDLFYAEAQLGTTISTASGGGTWFAYAPGVGYRFDTHADLGLRYEGWAQSGFTKGQIAVRLAYSF
ncbi:MAG TPA: outer membrane beta-barrel protein, partial [Mucilaginibacter sp.]